MDTCETVFIKGGKDGPFRINKSDYDADPKKYGDLYEPSGKKGEELAADEANRMTTQEPAPPVTVLPPGAVAPSPPNWQVVSEGTGKNKRSFVVHPTGEHVNNVPGIDAGGYADDGKAWEAVLALTPQHPTTIPTVPPVPAS